MGWLYQHDPIDDPLAYLKAKYNYDCDTHTLQTLDGGRVRNTIYLAVKSTDKKTRCSFVFAAVILISNTRKHGFGYKDMDETMGPCECDCPQRIMHLLSPLDEIPHPGYTAEWRARVAARHDERHQQRQRRNSLRIGSTVTLQTAVRFPGGATATAFCVAYFRRKTPIFLSLDGPEFYCRLTAATLAAATISELRPAAESVLKITN